ncbi:MAG: cobalamin-binding protein [Spirochaetales bacterium]
MNTKHIYVYCTVFFGIVACLFAGGTKDYTANQTTSLPQRIVSLSPAATEIIFALGAGEKLVARTDFCNYPQEAQNIPSVGGFDGKSFSVESIIAQNPDFVYASKNMHDYLKTPLESYGIQIYLSDAQSFDAIFAEITDISHIIGKEENGIALITDMQNTLDIIKSKISIYEPKTLYWEIWNSPYMSIGASSYLQEVIEYAGAKNIFSDIEQAYPVVSEEAIIAGNPDIIIIPDDAPTSVEDIMARTGWHYIQAVQNADIYFFDADIISRPGPRLPLAVKLLAEKLFPDERF